MLEMQREMQKEEGKRQKAQPICAAAVLCLLTSAFCLSAGSVSGEVIDRVLAVVSGRLITLSDVNAAYDLGLVKPHDSGDRVRDVLSQLIDRELQLAEVDRYTPPEPSAADIDREVETVRSRFPSPEALEAVLARSGIDLAHLRETIRENLRIRGYLDQRFSVSEERRGQVVDDWIAGLRRRADIVDLYLPDR
jgi:hypothetical protein